MCFLTTIFFKKNQYASILTQDFCALHTYMSFIWIWTCIYVFYLLSTYLSIFLEINLEHTCKYICNINTFSYCFLPYLFCALTSLLLFVIEHSSPFVSVFSVCNKDDVMITLQLLRAWHLLVTISSVDGHIYCKMLQ